VFPAEVDEATKSEVQYDVYLTKAFRRGMNFAELDYSEK
jgi:hypothetical protein